MPIVLLIDDDDAIRRLLRTALEEAGYSVREAANGIEGLRMFREAHADLVITDIYMPGCDGLEVIQTFLRIKPGTKVLAITGRSETANFLKVARMLGAAGVLKKPFAIEELLQIIARLLQAEPPIR
jgi:two-component system chemotaxis response regulator CheY